MYRILTVNDKVRVPPIKFELGLENAIKSSLEDLWEGVIYKSLGVILSVVSIDDVGEGKILPGDGGIHYPVKFKIMSYYPDLHDVVKGNVIDVTEFGIFVRIGPLDGMIHVSQLMNDFVSYDEKNNIFVGRESKRIIKDKDPIIARVISVSMGAQYKIGLTTRQVGLGVMNWVDKEKEDVKAPKPKKPPQAKGGK